MPILSKNETEALIRLCAREGNVLPVTSRCDARCVFCSHKNNPPEVVVATAGVRTLGEIADTMGCLRPDREILIGESASRIIEGEPLTHPEFREIIRLLRARFPQTPVAITTNGRGLDAAMVDFLADTGNVLLNLSMNSATVRGRGLLMGDTPEQAETAIGSVRRMRERGLVFDGSLVAMPKLTGWADIRESAGFLAENGARSVRVFAPGFSKFARDAGFPDPAAMMDELQAFVYGFSEDLPCPVLTEPSQVSDLKSVLSGVVKNSPAWNAGFRRGDALLSVDGRRPYSRVECYGLLYPAGPHRLEFMRGGARGAETLFWERAGGFGGTFEYDFDPGRARALQNAAETGPGPLLVLCSEAAIPVLEAVTAGFGLPEGKLFLRAAPNRTFGGSIRAAGLLCVSDYLAAFRDFCAETGQKPDRLAVPSESFDLTGRDLKGERFEDLQKRAGVMVVSC